MKLEIPAPDQLTMNDLEVIEDVCGKTFTEVFGDMGQGRISAKAIKALIYLQERRGNKAFTLEMAGRLSMDEIEMETPGDVDEVDVSGKVMEFGAS